MLRCPRLAPLRASEDAASQQWATEGRSLPDPSRLRTLRRQIPDAEALLGGAQEGDHVYVRAYRSEERAPPIKLQLQSLKELGVAEAQVRVGNGTAVKAAYASENRGDVSVGGGLAGIHHAKSVLVSFRRK